MANIVIANARVVTLDARNTVIDGGTVVIRGETIFFVGKAEDYVPQSGDKVIDAKGHMVMPGFVNAHTHSVMQLSRGFADELNWDKWLPRFYEFDGNATDDDIRLASQLACADLLLSGVTTIADRYGPLDPEASAVVNSGIRAAVVSSITSRQAETTKRAAIDMIDALGTSTSRRVFAALGPHATDTCDPETMTWVRQTAEARDAKIHLHVAQCEEEIQVVKGRGFKGSVDYLRAQGVLGPHVLGAHCIYLEDFEMELLAESGTHVCHCPASNIKLEGRTAATRKLLNAGVNVCLGNDCASSNNSMDLISELKIASLVNKLVERDTAFLTAAETLRMAITSGAKALGLESQIGSLEKGKRADLIVIHVEHPHSMPWHDPASMLVYTGSGRDVRHVFVDGEWVVKDRVLMTYDVADLLGRANAARARLDAAVIG